MNLKKFIEKENINFNNILSPKFVFNLLYKYKYIHFFLTGASGALVALIIIALLTEFIFGQEKYFTAYLIGLLLNLIYNFTLHTKISFKTKKKHIRRFTIFITYSLIMASIQATIVKIFTPILGLEYYLFVIASTILLFSIINFFSCKLLIFFEK